MTVSEGFLLYSEYQVLHDTLKLQITSDIKKKILATQKKMRASLVAQWLRVCLPMQGTRVRALVWEDPTCHGATGPVSHNC